MYMSRLLGARDDETEAYVLLHTGKRKRPDKSLNFFILRFYFVSVQYNSTDYVYTGLITNDVPVTVPMSIKAPNTPEPHKLIVILSINTHQALDPAHGDAQWETQGMG